MLPASFHDLTAIMQVAPKTWRTVLDTAGESERLQGETLTHEQLLASLHTHPPRDELLDALEAIDELGSELGREQLQQAADAFAVPLQDADDLPIRELVAQLWVRSRSNAAVANALTHARFNASGRAKTRPSREFWGKRAGAGGVDRERLEGSIKAWCEANHVYSALTVAVHRRGNELLYEVLRGDPPKRVTEMRDKGPRSFTYRPASSDVLRYDLETGRLSIATRSSRRLQMYRQVFGKLLNDDAEFFSNENICTLHPLQELGPALFAHLPPEILRVDVVELRWRRGDRDKVHIQGDDCFALVKEFGLRMAEGTLIEARLSIAIAGNSRRVSADIKVPNRIDIHAGRYQPLIERLLDEVCLRGRFDERGRQITVWSTYPSRETLERWRQVLGVDADALAQEQLLTPVRLQSLTPPERPAAIGALTVISDGKGLMVGHSEDPAVAMRKLTSSDVQGFKLMGERVAQRFRAQLALGGACHEVEEGLWSLGTRTLCCTVNLTVFLAMRQPSRDAERLMRAQLHGSDSVLLVPTGDHSTIGIPHVPFNLHEQNARQLLARVVMRLGLQSKVPPELWTLEDFVLDTASGRAWYRDQELTKLTPTSNAFRFAVMVASAKGQMVTKADLNDALSPERGDEVVKEAKRDFQNSLRASFEAAGKTCPPDATAIFPSVRGGYRLNPSISARVLP